MRFLILALALLWCDGAGAAWPEYQVIYWQDFPAGGAAAARSLGVTAQRLRGTGGEIDAGELAARQAIGLPFYIENIATDFYAPYHRFVPGRAVTAAFDEARRRHLANPADVSVFERAPSLSDPAELMRVTGRLTDVVRRFAPDRPLYYALGDETGIADLAAAWDFDVSPPALAAFRVWLRARYGTLEALNRQWERSLASWDEAAPMLTTEAMGAADRNVSAWMDFKAFMDTAFADAVRAGTRAVHAGDPAALAAIEGAQVPGWGGYDYGLLADAVDVLEAYDAGGNVEIAHALNPGLVLLTTSFAAGPAEAARLWRELLLGGRGAILWDDAQEILRADGGIGPRGTALAPVLAALRSAPARRVMAATVHRSPVAVLYSQASFRMTWLLAHRGLGDGWTQRSAGTEFDEDNAWRSATMRALGSLTALGLAPSWVTSATLETGAMPPGIRVLILPHSIALSEGEVAAVGAFVASGGVVLADGRPGRFDGHGRPRAEGIAWPADAMPRDEEALSALLEGAGVTAPVSVRPALLGRETGLEVRVFDEAEGMLVALQPAPGATVSRDIDVAVPAHSVVEVLRGEASVAAGGDVVRVRINSLLPTVLSVRR